MAIQCGSQLVKLTTVQRAKLKMHADEKRERERGVRDWSTFAFFLLLHNLKAETMRRDVAALCDQAAGAAVSRPPSCV